MFYRRVLHPKTVNRHETEGTRFRSQGHWDAHLWVDIDSDGLLLRSALIGPPGLTPNVCGAMSCARAARLVSPTSHEKSERDCSYARLFLVASEMGSVL